MLVIRRCLLGSKGAGDEKLKYYDIPSIPSEGFSLISTDSLHAPPKGAHARPQPKEGVEDGEESEIDPQSEETQAEAQHDEIQFEAPPSDETIAEEPRPNYYEEPEESKVEEPQQSIEPEIDPQSEETQAEAQHDEIQFEAPPSDETIAEEPRPNYYEEPEESKVEEPQQSIEPEIQDLSWLFGLRDTNRSSLYRCTEILGSESCDNMVQEMSEAVTEWSWTRKRQRQKAIEKEMLANRSFPPPIPRYIGRPCQFMKIKRRDGTITMSLVQMDRQPEQMLIEREDGQIKMQLMTYVGDAMNADDAEASTSASTSKQVVETSDQETTSDEDERETDNGDSSEQEMAKAA